MADYSKSIALAQRLINAKGRTVTLRKYAGAADVAQPWKGSGAPVVAWSEDIKAAFVPVSGTNFGDLVRDKDRLKTVERVLLIAPGTNDFAEATVVIDGGQTYGIKWVDVLRPGDSAVLYAAGVER